MAVADGDRGVTRRHAPLGIGLSRKHQETRGFASMRFDFTPKASSHTDWIHSQSVAGRVCFCGGLRGHGDRPTQAQCHGAGCWSSSELQAHHRAILVPGAEWNGTLWREGRPILASNIFSCAPRGILQPPGISLLSVDAPSDQVCKACRIVLDIAASMRKEHRKSSPTSRKSTDVTSLYRRWHKQGDALGGVCHR